MDTVGTIVDKLITVDMKMWNGQENLYKIRKMTCQEFEDRYKDNLPELFECLQKCCDLNYQRNNLINEIDEKLIQMITDAQSAKDLDKYQQKPHKTY